MIKRVILYETAFIILLLGYYFAPMRELPIFHGLFGISFLVVFSILIPGLVLHCILSNDKTDLVDVLATSSVYGLSLLLLIAFIWALFEGSLASFEKFWPIFTLPILITFPILSTRSKQRRIMVLGKGKLAQAIILLVSAYIFFLTLKTGPPIDFTKDTYDHIGYVSEIRESGDVLPTNAFYNDAGAYGQDIRKGLLHFIYAFLGDFPGIEPDQSLRYLDAFIAALMLLAIYASALRLFGNRLIAALSSLFFLMNTSGGLSSTYIREVVYPNRATFIFFIFFLTFSLDYMKSRDSYRLPSVILFAFASAASHVFYGILVAFAILVMAIWKTCFPASRRLEHLKRILTIGISAMAGVLPCLLFRYFATYQGANALHAEIQGVVFITKSLFIIDPFKLQIWFGLFGLLSFLAIIPLWKHRRENVGLGYLIASFMSIPLVLLNPLFLPPLHRAITYLSFRLIYICPFYMLAALYMCFIIQKMASRKRIGLLNGILMALISLTLVHNLLGAFPYNCFSEKRIKYEGENSPRLWAEGIAFLKARLPQGSIIASDPLTSYSIPAFTSHYVVCTLDQHAPPNDFELENRIERARAIMSPFTSIGETTSMLAKENCHYIVINAKIPERRLLHYWSISPKLAERIRTKFLARRDIFTAIYDKEGFCVIHWNGQETPEDTIRSTPIYSTDIPHGFEKIRLKAGEARLEAYKPFPPTAKRGESISTQIAWSIDRELSLGNYTVSIRFDYINLELPLNGFPFPKISRKLKERISGERFRFRSDHKIKDGFMSPDLWSPGVLVIDDFNLSIPDDVARGRYEIFAKLLKLADQPSYRLRDLVYDEDLYQGVPIGEIIID